MISKCAVSDIHHCASGSHWRKVFSEGSLIVLAFTFYPPTFLDATESTVFVASAKDTHICSCKAA